MDKGSLLPMYESNHSGSSRIHAGSFYPPDLLRLTKPYCMFYPGDSQLTENAKIAEHLKF